ncbi:MAG: hypothetical protein AB2A00_09965 [Myxococcota bacterium]
MTDDDNVFRDADTAARAEIAASQENRDQPVSLARQLTRLHQRGDLWPALKLAMEKVNTSDESIAAGTYLQRNRDALLQACEWRLGGFTNTPRVRISKEEMARHKLDHRSAYLLFMIDGQHTYEDLLQIAGVPELEGAYTFAWLHEAGIIENA